jgi:hypothetical protein
MKDRPAVNLLDEIFLRSFRPYLWLIGIGFLLYCRVLSFGFVYFDDYALIFHNFRFLSDTTSLFQAFRQGVFNLMPNSDAFYRPLLTVSLIADAVIGGRSPFIYHLSNIVWHLLASCLVFALLREMDHGRLGSFVLALVFTCHPVLTQAVAWIPGRNDSMLTVLVLISFWFFLRYLSRGGRFDLASQLLFFALALFTKETAVFLAGVCWLYLRLVVREPLGSKREWGLLAGWLGVILLWLFCRQAALAGTPPIPAGVLLGAFRDNWPALLQYTGKIFFPIGLSVLPSVRETPILPGLAAATILAVFLWFSREADRGRVLFGLSWFILFLLPALFYFNQTAGPGAGLLLEHRVYLPIVGILIALLETNLFRPGQRPNWLAGVAVVVLISGLAIVTLDRLAVYRDPLSFGLDAVRAAPRSALAHNNLGVAYQLAGDSRRAKQEYVRSLELNPVQSDAYYNLGLVNDRDGDKAEAALMWEQAVKINPGLIDAYKNLAHYYWHKHDRSRVAYYTGELKKRGVDFDLSGHH